MVIDYSLSCQGSGATYSAALYAGHRGRQGGGSSKDDEALDEMHGDMSRGLKGRVVDAQVVKHLELCQRSPSYPFS